MLTVIKPDWVRRWVRYQIKGLGINFECKWSHLNWWSDDGKIIGQLQGSTKLQMAAVGPKFFATAWLVRAPFQWASVWRSICLQWRPFEERVFWPFLRKKKMERNENGVWDLHSYLAGPKWTSKSFKFLPISPSSINFFFNLAPELKFFCNSTQVQRFNWTK